MITIDSFVPTRIVFGAGRLAELVSVDLPGKRALICTTSHHIIAQAIGGMFPNVPHGAALVMIAEKWSR